MQLLLKIVPISRMNSLAPRRDSWLCVGDSTNKGESMRFPEEKTKEDVGRGGERLRDEGGNATGSVTVSCRLVLAPPPPAP